MRLLDLFCGAGGAAMGYHRAGFDEIVGVDISPQPNYPFEFVQADALDVAASWDLDAFDLIHASPPCQAYSTLKGLVSAERPMLVDAVRGLIDARPYVIENVVGAPLRNPIRLCGSSFGLRVWRDRLEMSHPPALTPPCSHYRHPKPLDVTGTGGPSSKPRRTPGGGVSRKPRNLAEAGAAMGIDWMTRRELSEAIPPAFTQFIGEQFIAQVPRGVS